MLLTTRMHTRYVANVCPRVSVGGAAAHALSADLLAKGGPLSKSGPGSDDDHHEVGGNGDDHKDLQEVDVAGWHT